MRRTLRKKFILFAMAAVTVLLLVLMLSINGLAWLTFERQSDEMMSMLIASGGNFMRMEPPENEGPQIPLPDRDMMRSARFFTVFMDENGAALFANVDEIFFVDIDEAIEYANQAIKKGTSSGRIDRYKYAIEEINEGKKVYFLDITRETLTIRTLLRVSAIIAAISWIIVFAFVVLLSGTVVHPIVAGIEKQKQFITNAGHELKTPLAIIQSNNDAMSLIYGENKYNRNIKEQVTRLSQLTANLLLQAKLDEEIELKKESVDISELTASFLLPYKDTADAAGLAFTASVMPDLHMNTNSEAFTQLLGILMDNAVKYTTPGGDIDFSLVKESGHVFLTEENSCERETDNDPEKLFERFYRADSARTQTDRHSGYGIGLSAARSICEALGAKLSAAYPSEGRIRFTVKF